FFQAEDGIRDFHVTGVQTCALPIFHTETIYSLTTRMTILLFSVPITSFLMRLTNHWHHLFYVRYEMREIAGYYSLYMERGLWYRSEERRVGKECRARLSMCHS